jgi:hypothetical protein
MTKEMTSLKPLSNNYSNRFILPELVIR